jgi:hypothetical protein
LATSKNSESGDLARVAIPHATAASRHRVDKICERIDAATSDPLDASAGAGDDVERVGFAAGEDPLDHARHRAGDAHARARLRVGDALQRNQTRPPKAMATAARIKYRSGPTLYR